MKASRDLSQSVSGSLPVANREALQDLLRRVESATGADRELDALLHLICHERRVVWWEGNNLYSRHPSEPSGHRWIEGCIDPGEANRNWQAKDYRHPAYTASLDAALALVGTALPGWRLKLAQTVDGAWRADLLSPTIGARPAGYSSPLTTAPPLALCAALLRAKIAEAEA